MLLRSCCAAESMPPLAGRIATSVLDISNDVGEGATSRPLSRSFRRRPPPNWRPGWQRPPPGTSPSGATSGTRTERDVAHRIIKRVLV